MKVSLALPVAAGALAAGVMIPQASAEPLAAPVRIRTTDLRPSVRLAGAPSAEVGGTTYTLTPHGWFADECVHAHGAPHGRYAHWPEHIDLVERKVGASSVTDVVNARTGVVVDSLPACTHGRKRLHAVAVVDEDSGVVTEDVKVRSARRGRGDTTSSSPFPASYEGWQTYTSWNNTQGDISSFVGLISTPMDVPEKRALVVYIFTGLQNVDWVPIVDPEPPSFDIIQPVLQYPGGFGDYWGVRSWYVSLNAGSIASKEVKLELGDEILGNMTRTGPTSYTVVSTNRRTGESTAANPNNERLTSQPWAYVTLETYGAKTCSYLPKTPSKFTAMSLTNAQGQSLSPNWVLHMAPKEWLKCPAVSCDIIDPADISIEFVQS